ncbi:hypothetical protein ACP70R_008130 [Stipagrostis hirtigluma subsp. patula]
MNRCRRVRRCVAAAWPPPLLVVAPRAPLPRDGETQRHRGLGCR